MASRTALRASGGAAAGSSAFRTSVPRLFTPLTLSLVRAPPLRCAPISTSSSFRVPLSAGHVRRLYSTQQPPLDLDAEIRLGAEHDKAERDSTLNLTSSENQSTGDQAQEEPWYLQEEPPRHPTLIPEIQPLPEIPRNTPTILAPLVKFVAEDLGLDDLNLMDLRTLDPPPALGPSLVMLFGTARSDRHLHIAAGSLKSWLRQHGINAHADGLLGRNEYKIKLRRKQRKAKLLGTSATALGSDDGISTGWICVNLGTIGSAVHHEMPVETSDGKFAGFGARQTGVTTIVVQMLTEAKRRDLDLETLWSRILARRGNDRLIEDDLEYVEADTDPNELSIFTEGGSPKVFATPSQRRFLSTSCRRLSPPGQTEQVTDPPTRSPATDNVDTSLDPVRYINAKIIELEQLQARFASLSYTDATEALVGLSKEDQPSKFFRQWHSAIRFLPPEQSWQFRLWFCAAGRKLGLPDFTLSRLRDLVQEMELIGVICERGHFLDLLQAAYLEPANDDLALDELSELAIDILNIMFERGEPIIATDVIVSLIESLARSESQGAQQLALQAVLENFLLQADLPYMGEDALARLLDAYAVQNNWERWWDMWCMPPRHQQPRSARLYVHLWRTMAASNHQRRCREAIRRCFHEMLNENPHVSPTGHVKEALEACIRVADPAAEEIARRLRVTDVKTQQISMVEFVHLFRQLNPHWTVGSTQTS